MMCGALQPAPISRSETRTASPTQQNRTNGAYSAACAGLGPILLIHLGFLRDTNVWRMTLEALTKVSCELVAAPAVASALVGVATVAVLFTDLVDSTATAERLGPVAADQQRRDHFSTLRRALDAHGGTEVKTTGDGLMVVFESPSQAVDSAVAMQVADRRLLGGASARTRTGIGFGECIDEDGDFFGIPAVRAARLCAVAKPGQVIVDEYVAALADHASARFEPLGDLTLKGMEKPVRAMELLWDATGRSVPLQPALHAAQDRFVGRERQLDRLQQAWERARAGETRLSLVAGEPGAGKTSIAAELARRLHDEGSVVLFGRCDDGIGMAYQPFAQALGHYVTNAPNGVIEDYISDHGGDLVRLVPHLSTRVPSAKPTIGDPAGEQWALSTAVHALLQVAAPALLIVDDLHWAAPPTLQLLSFLLQTDRPAPVLIVATYRDTEVARTHPLADALAEFRRLEGVERLHVDGLEPSETETLVAKVAGHDLDDAERALASVLHDRTEGNPFFALETLRHFAESGVLVYEGDRWRSEVPPESFGLPEGVKEVIGRRLARLPAPTNEALAVAATAGPEFDADVVGHVLKLPPLALLDALRPAVDAGIVRELAQPSRFAFTHALIRTTIYDEAGASRRVHLHGRVAEAIEAVHAGNLGPWLADLAFHYAESAYPGRVEEAVEFALLAAAQARAHAAASTTVAILERGLDVARTNGGTDVQIARLLVPLIEAVALDDPARARQYAIEAADLAERAGHFDLLAGAAANMWSTFQTSTAGAAGGDTWLEDLCERALARADGLEPVLRVRLRALHVLSRTFTVDRGDPTPVGSMLDEALATGDPLTMVLAAQASSVADGVLWEPARTWAVYDAALGATEDQHLRGMAGVYMSWNASMSGDRTRYELSLSLVQAAAEALGGPRFRTWAAWIRAQQALRHGAWDEAIAATTEARDTAVDPAIGQIIWSIHVGSALLNQGQAASVLDDLADSPQLDISHVGMTAMLGLVQAAAGDSDRARATLGSVVAALADGGDTFVAVAVAGAAWAACLIDDPTFAPSFEEALDGYRGWMAAGGMLEIGAVDRILGMLEALQGRHDEADGLFRSGLDLEERFGAIAPAAHTRYWWARSLIERDHAGDAATAAALLRDGLETAERLGMAQLAGQTRELLGNC